MLHRPPPTSVAFVREVQVSHKCRAVYHYNNQTYVAHDSGVDRVDEYYQRSESLIKSDKTVWDVTVYDNKLYTLVDGKPQTVKIYRLDGQQITSLDIPSTVIVDELVIVGHKIVIPHVANRKVILYSLEEKEVKYSDWYVRCDFLLSWRSLVYLCAADDECVIVADPASSKVFKMDFTSIVWQTTAIYKPQIVKRYGQNYVCVLAEGYGGTLWILDISTGEWLVVSLVCK